MEELNNIEIVIPVKRGRRRPAKPKAPIAPIDDAIPVEIKPRKPRGPKPTPDGPALNPAYFIQYYHKHLAQRIRCDKCGSCVTKQKIKKHQNTARCINTHLTPFVENLLKPENI